jgi:protein-S-isoprenylcysteine O-methyltransferase Ste14
VKASAFVFRFRYLIHTVIYILGFWGPWNLLFHLDPRGPNAHVWGILAANLSQLGVGSLFTAFNLLLSLGILFALAGAALRTWGSAYIGANIVSSQTMHTAQNQAAGDGILKDGPFAHLRNPLYVGTFLHTLALSLLMPRSGAIFTIAAIGLLQLYLIQGEEAFLTAKLGEPYKAYCALVPRLFPALRRKVAATGLTPRWPQAFLGEIYFWGVALSFAFLGWRYNAALLMQCVIVSVGISIVTRALTSKST